MSESEIFSRDSGGFSCQYAGPLFDSHAYERYMAEQPEPVHITVRDGRTVAVQIMGPEYGVPLFSLHGNPGSRVGPHLHPSALGRMGVRVIAPDESGFGRSTRNKGRRVVDTAWDIEDIADYLGIDRFGMIARSGGGPRGLGCVAMLPERISGFVSVAGVSPKEEAGINWTLGMNDSNQSKYAAAVQDPEQLAEEYEAYARAIRKDPAFLMKELYEEGLTGQDALYFISSAYGSGIAAGHAEGLRQGGDGWLDATLALTKPWGFKVSQINTSPDRPTVPMRICHGTLDQYSPIEHARWLAGQIPGAELEELHDSAHFSPLDYYEILLRWLRNQHIGPDKAQRIEDLQKAQEVATSEEIERVLEGPFMARFFGREEAPLLLSQEARKEAARRVLWSAADPSHEHEVVRSVLTGEPLESLLPHQS